MGVIFFLYLAIRKFNKIRSELSNFTSQEIRLHVLEEDIFSDGAGALNKHVSLPFS